MKMIRPRSPLQSPPPPHPAAAGDCIAAALHTFQISAAAPLLSAVRPCAASLPLCHCCCSSSLPGLSLLLSLHISSCLCQFGFGLISAPPSPASSALSLSIPSLFDVCTPANLFPPPPPPSQSNQPLSSLNSTPTCDKKIEREKKGVDKMHNLARAG